MAILTKEMWGEDKLDLTKLENVAYTEGSNFGCANKNHVYARGQML
jgi:hypothetical protein